MNNAIKLNKIVESEWHGNGLGTSGATYAVEGHEHIHVYNADCSGLADWVARDSNLNKFLIGRYNWKKSELISQLEDKIVSDKRK